MSLKYYLQEAYKKVRLTSDSQINTLQHLDGTLQSDKENLILVYGGSFNPPHRGHVDVLLSGLSKEVAAVAIVILPSEDFHLRHKVVNSHPEFFLQMKRRADIWSAIPSVPKAKVWVWSTTWYPFKPFTEALIQMTKAEGYKVAFSHMIGPDNLILNDPLNILPYRLPRVLVCNKARHVSAHFSADGKPIIWDGFGEWSRRFQPEENKGESHVVLWTCRGVGDGNDEKRGYYLQFAESASADINSTDLRRTLRESHHFDEASLNQLSTEALLELLAPVLKAD